MTSRKKKIISYSTLVVILLFVLNQLWPYFLGLISPHISNAGIHGCIPKSDMNLDAALNFVGIFVQSEGFYYIHFDKVHFHPHGSPEVVYSNVNYRFKDSLVLAEFNAKMNSSLTQDKDSVAVGICSDKIYNTEIWNFNKKKYFTSGALYYKRVQIYPDIAVCNCNKGCKDL